MLYLVLIFIDVIYGISWLIWILVLIFYNYLFGNLICADSSLHPWNKPYILIFLLMCYLIWFSKIWGEYLPLFMSLVCNFEFSMTTVIFWYLDNITFIETLQRNLFSGKLIVDIFLLFRYGFLRKYWLTFLLNTILAK